MKKHWKVFSKLLLAVSISGALPAVAYAAAAEQGREAGGKPAFASYSSAGASVGNLGDEIVPRRPGLTPDKGVSVTTGSSVDVGNGTYTFTETDLKVPSFGIPMVFERTYRSNQIMKEQGESAWHFALPMDSPLGYGWYSPYFVRLGTDGSFVDGQGNYLLFDRDANGNFLPSSSTGYILKKTAGGYELIRRGENTLVFDGDGWLRQIRDGAGNQVTLQYGSNGRPVTVSDVTGRTVFTFTYNARGHLETVTDIAGRIVLYQYDAIDNLTNVYLNHNGTLITLGSYAYDMVDYGMIPMTCSHSTTYQGSTKITYVSCKTVELKPEDQFGYTCKSKEWYVDGVRYEESNCTVPLYKNNYHNMIRKTTPTGESYTIDYHPKWRSKGIVRNITDSSGRTMNFSFSFNDGVFYYTDYDGRRYKKMLNDKGQLVRFSEIVSDPSGQTEELIKSISYQDGRVEVTTDALGNVTKEQKDEWGKVIKRTDAEGYSWSYQYDVNGHLITVTDPAGTATRYEYDEKGNRIKEIVASGTADESVATFTYGPYNEIVTTASYGSITTFEYDDAGNGKKITDAEGRSIIMTHDPAGNLLTRTVPLIGTTTYANYDWKGNPGTVTDPNGNVIVHTYDTTGRLLTSTNEADGGVTTYTYVGASGTCQSGCSSGGNGKVASITHPEGNRVGNEYNINGHLTKKSDNDGNYISYTLDRKGNKIKEEVKDAGGAVQKSLSYKYDALGRMTEAVTPDGGSTRYVYDKRGKYTEVIDPNGNTTLGTYDFLRRLIKVTQPGNAVTSYTYDKRHNLTCVTDAAGNTTSYEYDKKNRLIKTISPDTGVIAYSYDKVGNLKTKTDARGTTESYVYDAANRLIDKEFSYSSEKVSYSYDNCTNGAGRLCSITGPSSTTAYDYTKRGQLAKETTLLDGKTFVTEYAYDKNGNITAINYPSGRIVTYGYANNRVSEVLNNGVALATNIGYKPFGGIHTFTFGNGIQQTNDYDQQYRLTAINTSTIQSLVHSYDKNGNITAIADNLDGSNSTAYSYDSLDRLTSALGPWGTLSYTYDGVGNRKTESRDGVTTTYAYKSNSNQLASLSGEKNLVFGYDLNGNIDTENARKYIYNQNQRLIRITDQVAAKDKQGVDVQIAVTRGEYIYNGVGQRAGKTVNGQTTHFIYDQQGKLISESGATNSDYVFLNEKPLAKIEGGKVQYIHTSHLGTPQKMTDEQKNATWQIEATPYGEVIGITGAATNNLRFPGQYSDQESGLYYNYFRDYHPATGRYLESDPVGIDYGFNHIYGYAKGNPLLWKDPFGLTATCPSDARLARANKGFFRYPNRDGEVTFHCGFECYLENRKTYCPEDPGAECCYDEKGGLVGSGHKYAKCGGSNDDYLCKGMGVTLVDCLLHTGPMDRGGVFRRGFGAWVETQRHTCDTNPGSCLW